MMNYFQPCNNQPKSIMTFTFFSFFFLVASVAAAGRENPLVELSSRDDLIELAGYGEEKLSTVVVSGTVLCNSCLDRNSHRQPHPIRGGLVAVSCHATGKSTRKSNWVRGMTDEYGEFFLDLPSHLHAIPNLENKCIVKILQLPKNSPCHRAFTGKHKRIKLISSGNGSRVYTTQGIHLTPKSTQPCMHKGRKGKKRVHSY